MTDEHINKYRDRLGDGCTHEQTQRLGHGSRDEHMNKYRRRDLVMAEQT